MREDWGLRKYKGLGEKTGEKETIRDLGKIKKKIRTKREVGD